MISSPSGGPRKEPPRAYDGSEAFPEYEFSENSFSPPNELGYNPDAEYIKSKMKHQSGDEPLLVQPNPRMKPPPALPKEEYIDETMEQLKAMGEYVLDAEEELENEREKSLEEKNLKVTYDPLVEYIHEKDQEISAEQDKYQGIKNIAKSLGFLEENEPLKQNSEAAKSKDPLAEKENVRRFQILLIVTTCAALDYFSTANVHRRYKNMLNKLFYRENKLYKLLAYE